MIERLTGKVRVIIPALNEEKSIGLVLKDIPSDWVEEVIVVNNASSDDTGKVAKANGATVLDEPQKGYGAACLKGMEYLKKQDLQDTEIVVFLDADYSDYPEEIPKVLAPILKGEAEMVIGSRALGKREKGAMTPQQVVGNWLATRLLYLFYKVRFTDLGPFRAIRYEALMSLGMRDTNYGWTVEMQLRAAKKKLAVAEVPVQYRKRVGVSKVSGTIKGSVLAGYKILYTIFRYL